ncbi:CHAP domain-containing protein [Clostridiaceae bacterium]|nr:CHAP domain-containing protein [Lachnospiraceae bacterium]NBH19246.1 CHAP domain-containing protein [Clostridiaceae bacterium]
MKAIEKLISIAKQEIGYLEKASSKDLDSKTGNAGSKNYTKYARDLYPTLQGQPWCDMFVDWCFVQAFGKITGKKLIGGGFSAYTPTSAQYFKDQGQWRTSPEPGDQVFFENSVRIYHTGIVVKVDAKKIYTIEGNTSQSSGVVANGGGVFEKSYSQSYAKIAGYGHPDWSLTDVVKYTIGWNRDENGWWYADTENTYFKSGWQIINGHKYYFNGDGYALKNWNQIDGKWYYFENIDGHPLECALYVTDSQGVQTPGEF